MQLNDRVIGLRRIKANELIDNPNNWRRHPDVQRSALSQLLEQIGIADACIARQTPDGLELIDGHLRKELVGEELLPVLVLDVSEAEAQTLLLSLDPLAAMALAHEDALATLMEMAVAPEEILEELHRQHLQAMARASRPDPDEIPPTRTGPGVKTGEVWSLGPHRLICADTRDPETMRRLLGDQQADLLLTDPPYGVDYEGKTARSLTIQGDGSAGIAELLSRSFAAVDAVLRPGAALYVFHPAGSLIGRFVEAFEAQGWRLHQTLIWMKDRMVLGHSDYHYRHEPILYGYRPGRRRGRGRGGWYGGDDQDSVLQVPRPAASPEHPTAKPVELLALLVRNSSRVNAAVLDPFAGSGSTLIACEELGRRAFLAEIDPAYCDVIVRRWEAFTGQKARRDDG